MPERKLWAKCAEPNCSFIEGGVLHWEKTDGLPDIDATSSLIKILGDHHSSFLGLLHGNFALFINKNLAQSPPVESVDPASVARRFPLNIGTITVAREYDERTMYPTIVKGYRAYGDIKSYVK